MGCTYRPRTSLLNLLLSQPSASLSFSSSTKHVLSRNHARPKVQRPPVFSTQQRPLPRHLQLPIRLRLPVLPLPQEHLRPRPQRQPARGCLALRRTRRAGRQNHPRATQPPETQRGRPRQRHGALPHVHRKRAVRDRRQSATETINKACLVYSASRLVYAAAYLTIDKHKLSYIRSLAWWASSFTCMYLLWQSGKTMNASLA